LEHNSQGSDRWEKNIQTLAHAFDVDFVRLRSQVVDLGTIAQQYYRTSKQSFLSCWIHTVQRVNIRGSTLIAHATYAVREILYRYVVFKPCTSRVEQYFSVVKEVLGDRRRNSSATTEDDITKVVLDIPRSLAEREEIIESARAVWREHYGVSRTAKLVGDKLDKGFRKALNSHQVDCDIALPCRTEFLRLRRGEP
jgi:hypothetical protein